MAEELVIPGGTYTNFNISYNGPIKLTGTFTVVGDFHVLSLSNYIDASTAIINASGASGTIMLATKGNLHSKYTIVNTINAPNYDVHLVASGSATFSTDSNGNAPNTFLGVNSVANNIICANAHIIGYGPFNGVSGYKTLDIVPSTSTTVLTYGLLLRSTSIPNKTTILTREQSTNELYSICVVPRDMDSYPQLLSTSPTYTELLNIIDTATTWEQYIINKVAAPLLTLGPGTYTNFNLSYDGPVKLDGAITVVGDFHLLSEGNYIDASTATITASGNSGTIMLATLGGDHSQYNTYYSIQAPNYTVYLISAVRDLAEIVVESNGMLKNSIITTNSSPRPSVVCNVLYMLGYGPASGSGYSYPSILNTTTVYNWTSDSLLLRDTSANGDVVNLVIRDGYVYSQFISLLGSVTVYHIYNNSDILAIIDAVPWQTPAQYQNNIDAEVINYYFNKTSNTTRSLASTETRLATGITAGPISFEDISKAIYY